MKIATAQILPVALVFGAQTSLGKTLCPLLASQNLLVSTSPDCVPSYIFDLTGTHTRQLLDLAVKNRAKYLLVSPSLKDKSAQEKLLDGYREDYKIYTVVARGGDASQIATLMFRPDTNGQTFFLGDAPAVSSPKPRRKIIFPFLVLMALVVFPLLAIFSQSFFGLQALRTTRGLLLSGEFDKAALAAQSARANFVAAKKDLRTVSPLPYLLGLRKPVDNLYGLLDIAENGSDTALHLSLAAIPLSKVAASLTSFAQDLDVENLLAAGNLETSQALSGLNFLQAKTAGRNLPYLDQLPRARYLLDLAGKLLPYGSDLLGINGRRTYLVLFQNNTELRPGGGFIGSYGLAIFDKGKLINFKISDVYEADGQLRGRVAPPDEILHFLGQPNWFLRDSNWSPDFALSARRAAWFLEKETGQTVDGVIGVDLDFVQKLLLVTGPLKLSDFNETVSADNFFQKAESQAEINFFPGSTQKRDFLAAAGQALFGELTGNDPKKLTNFAPAIYQSLEEKHLQLYFVNPKIQEILAGLVPQNIFSNQLSLIEANLGANKANYFIRRELLVQTDVGKSGELDTTLTVVYQNTSPGDSWPGGRYKNYLRLFVPSGSQFLGASLGDDRRATLSSVLNELVLKSLSPDQFLVYQSSESGQTTFGTLLEVPANSQKTLIFKYRPPQTLDFSQSFLSYNLAIPKQAGTGPDPLTVVVNFPPFLISQDPLVSGQQIRYNTTLSQDKSFKILWKKSL